jgi:hypothetical protein
VDDPCIARTRIPVWTLEQARRSGVPGNVVAVVRAASSSLVIESAYAMFLQQRPRADLRRPQRQRVLNLGSSLSVYSNPNQASAMVAPLGGVPPDTCSIQGRTSAQERSYVH